MKEDVLLEITLLGKKEKENETDTSIDREQWSKLRNNMIGDSPDDNIDNTTSLFDRIVIVNAFARCKYVTEIMIFVAMSSIILVNENKTHSMRVYVCFGDV